MVLQRNRMHAALAAGQVQIGTWLNLARNPAILTLLKSAGLDYARVGMEHSSPSIETVADMAVLACALEFPLVVRPPAGNREWITRLRDAGVWGLHVPAPTSTRTSPPPLGWPS
jgi:2-keto-3-deoxy-L-rhamnonate aldolase RhmA